jgi:hypothetical protein
MYDSDSHRHGAVAPAARERFYHGNFATLFQLPA